MNDIKGIIEDVEKSSLVSDNVIKKVIEIIGQEEWNDIHDEEDDICTTTGELIITLKGIAELEKENAELKKESDFYYAEKGNYKNSFLKRIIKEFKINKQLTKAKEIIEKLLNAFASNDFFEEEELNAMAEAEQFLQEISE